MSAKPPVAEAGDAALDDPRLGELIDRTRNALARNAPRTELLALIEDIADVNRDGLRSERRQGVAGAGRVRLLEHLTKLILTLRAGDADFAPRIAAFLDGWPVRRQPSSQLPHF